MTQAIPDTTPTAETSPIDPADKSMDDIVALCKRRGFVYPASEIYGGINGFWDYGPLGTQLKNNVRDHWWKHMVECPPIGPDGSPLQIVGLDSAIIQNPRTWEASGHVGGFADPMRKCRRCGHFVRADHVWDIIVTSSMWFDSLVQECTPITGQIDTPRLMKWAKGKGKRLAPNLALVRNPEVTLGWLAQRVDGQSDAPPDVQEIARYLATEQLHADGLQDPCPRCGGELEGAQPFKLMFESYAGVTQQEENKVYLRPETAQGIFLNYKNVLDTMRVKVPFGIAQTGKAFRNEVTPRNFIFRSREFEQMEMQWFCHEDDSPRWYEFWKDQRMAWWRSLGVADANLRFRDHDDDELAHYSKMCVDVEYRYPFTAPEYGELEGIAHRGCFDLTQHENASGQKMQYVDPQRDNEKYIPNVIEPASGLTRGVLVLICEAYMPTPDRKGSKCVLAFAPHMAPVKAGIFPLVNKDGMPQVAQKLYLDLRDRFMCEFDAKQSIGKRYARMDEIGTPYCFTIDGQTLADQTVTVRDRDTTSQERINLTQVEAFLSERIRG
ncbi:MAG: glycine--tRNA ligase [Phycisphaeraceae bacterium]|nr:glycine--tRNA ligase [Phycisphaeraceae bacterium]